MSFSLRRRQMLNRSPGRLPSKNGPRFGNQEWSRGFGVALTLIVVTFVLLYVSTFSSVTNCGGNSAALSNVQALRNAALTYASDGPFSFLAVPPDAQEYLPLFS